MTKKLESLNSKKFAIKEDELAAITGGAQGDPVLTTTTWVTPTGNESAPDTTTTKYECVCDPCPANPTR